MRKSIAIIITSILVLSGCNKQQSVSDRLLNEVGNARPETIYKIAVALDLEVKDLIL